LKCEFCGIEESLPFVCNYCGGVFCSDHRLPEAHQCRADLSQKRTIVAPPPTTFSWSDSGLTSQPSPKPVGRVFSTIELRDITIAWLGLGLAFFFSFLRVQGLASLNLQTFFAKIPFSDGLRLSPAQILAISLFTVGPGFVLHELSHKFTAERYGYWAEFRMWPLGLALALVTSLIGFIFAAPGATYISGLNITKDESGKISLAGPATNVGVALLFLPFFLFANGAWGYLGFEGVFVNLFLALFNLLPVMPLDGAKVFAWNKARWATVFVPLAALFAFLFLG